MYCFITPCSVECYWHCSDETVHYKYNETVNFCRFRWATKSPITVIYELCFFYIYNIKLWVRICTGIDDLYFQN